METIYQFFNGVTANDLIMWGVTWLVFWNKNIGVRFLNFLKTTLRLEDRMAHIFILFTLVAFTLLSQFVTGAFVDFKITFLSFSGQFMSALIPAKLAYKRLKIGDVPILPEDSES